MIDSNELRSVACELFPANFAAISWGNAWENPIEQGKSFEWAVFTSILNAFARRGWKIDIPALAIPQFADRFVNDNRYPIHFTGRPGHQPTAGNIGHLILSCLVPKAILSHGSVILSIYREGWPYHQIHTPNRYLERPDILIARGAPNLSSLLLDANAGVVSYEYCDSDERILLTGRLRAVNASSPQPIDLFQREALSAACVVECSVNKLERRASSQLNAYAKTFFTHTDPAIFLVTGVPVPSYYAVCPVALNGNREELFNSLKASGDSIVKTLAETPIL
jgi:hypothetical protein